MNNSKKVDFVIVGTHKSGTTWLHKCLEAHPQVCMPQNPVGYSKNKKVEPEFFNDTQMPWRSDLKGTSNYTRGVEWYHSLFHHCGQNTLKGESSPIYFHAPEVPERMYHYNPKMKLIAILRNPVTRLFSLYNYIKFNDRGRSRVPPTFTEFLRIDEVIELSMYHTHVKRYLEHFKREQLLVFIYEDIEKKPEQIMQQVYGFLDIPTVPIPELATKRINSAESKAMEERARRLRKQYGRYLGKALSYLSSLSPTQQTKAETLHPEDIAYLHKMYRNEIANLETFLNRDLTIWKK